MNVVDILRIINIPLILLAITAWILFYKKYKLIATIAPLTWLLHVFIYKLYKVFFSPHSSDVCSIWTSLIITHAVILLFVAACMSRPQRRDNIRG